MVVEGGKEGGGRGGGVNGNWIMKLSDYGVGGGRAGAEHTHLFNPVFTAVFIPLEGDPLSPMGSHTSVGSMPPTPPVSPTCSIKIYKKRKKIAS